MSKVRARVAHNHNARWLDPIAVERAVARGDVRLTTPEMCAAIRTLRGRGLSARAIAEHLGNTDRSVQRHRGCDDSSHTTLAPRKRRSAALIPPN